MLPALGLEGAGPLPEARSTERLLLPAIRQSPAVPALGRRRDDGAAGDAKGTDRRADRCAPETLSRVLREWADQGLITVLQRDHAACALLHPGGGDRRRRARAGLPLRAGSRRGRLAIPAARRGADLWRRRRLLDRAAPPERAPALRRIKARQRDAGAAPLRSRSCADKDRPRGGCVSSRTCVRQSMRPAARSHEPDQDWTPCRRPRPHAPT